MDSVLLVETRPCENRVALIEGGRLAEMSVERTGGESVMGNIYLGRVDAVVAGMQAAFVNIGMNKNAFLFAGDFQMDKTDFGKDENEVREHFKNLKIQKMLKVGQEVLVQIVKLPGGDKGPRISSHITLPGRLCVLLPTVAYTGISRRIADDNERDRLREMADRLRPEGMGIIVRTLAEGVSEEELNEDIQSLKREWDAISRRAKCAKPPLLLHTDCDLVSRTVRDYLNENVSKMIFENSDAYTKGLEAAKMYAPNLADKIELDKGEIPLFTRYSVNSQLTKALSRRVWLKSGGYLIFDKTEALTVIDVNTGKYVGKSSLSETVFSINMEAAVEIAAQLRLRDLGGIIIVDFIDMDTREQKEKLLELLQAELKKDRTHTNLIGLTGLGLVELTRKRRREPLEASTRTVCPTCGGEGYVVSAESVAVEILTDISVALKRNPSQPVCARCSKRVYDALTSMPLNTEGRAYCTPDTNLADAKYEISNIDESSLPPKTKRLNGGNNE